ncbi:phage integrase N-terminal SAM-like domain-containing protein [Calidifontibacillus oryziterrae]|uniref:phage integrase N-terminal SAM-like domain-containing protein n=1 Tax=Calidifontibacillus oryziterrae TaxID=1191699 RepID=UPI000377AF56|nr:phage integrase N-terminal SAM-like domain-containing protein [Calidifontibacillus oryziterrae]
MWKKGWIIKDEEIESHTDNVINVGAYLNLMLQVNKIARHARSVSITTQRQYYHLMDLFVRYLADFFGVKSLRNISAKHIAAYVEYRQFECKSPATIKNDICAISYYHDQIEDTRFYLPDNKQLHEKYGINLEMRSFGGVTEDGLRKNTTS